MTVAEKLAELGIELPQVPAPAGAYVPALVDGDHVYTSGQLPFVDGELANPGVLGDSVTVEEGYDAAKLCAINALAAIKSVVGDLERVKQVVKVVGFVASAPGFDQQPRVINGASELLGEVFGERGQHARSAVGVSALPLGTSVEVEVTVRI
ncbi:RidA family protein [Brevibacterium paucivorans]|uniref:RidA family protein n=1 Tax=Brevibacterium paucivorans TaxID=170994 RepID=UPI00321BD4FF